MVRFEYIRLNEITVREDIQSHAIMKQQQEVNSTLDKKCLFSKDFVWTQYVCACFVTSKAASLKKER